MVRSDNTTVATYITKWEALSQCPAMKLLWPLGCGRRKETISYPHHYIPGVCNTEVDFQSWNFSDNTEWQLYPDHFREVVKRLGNPDIDLFASRLNHKTACYASLFPDPESTYVDAFSFSWSDFNLVYAFPPFSLMDRCKED